MTICLRHFADADVAEHGADADGDGADAVADADVDLALSRVLMLMTMVCGDKIWFQIGTHP